MVVMDCDASAAAGAAAITCQVIGLRMASGVIDTASPGPWTRVGPGPATGGAPDTRGDSHE